MFENVYTEVYIIMIILALLFFLFSKISINHLIIVIIILLISYALYFYLQRISNDKQNNIAYVQNTLDMDIKDRTETNEKLFYIDKFPKKIKYLKNNEKLIDIITNIRFIKKFNKTRYGDIILNANKLMKVYIYILSGRYDVEIYLPIFTDIRDNILELMNSLIMIIPEKLKHTYGLDTYAEIGNSLQMFTEYSQEMLRILEKYAKIHVKKVHIPDNKWKAYNIARELNFPIFENLNMEH
jgi:ABC-type multidrug transport system fused ATPase/permease subunit